MAHGLIHTTALSPPVDKAVRSECINVENDLVLFDRDTAIQLQSAFGGKVSKHTIAF